MFQSLSRVFVAFATGTLLQAGSCITVTNVGPEPGPGGGGGGGGSPTSVTVHFVNQTPFGVDPQFFVSSQPLGDPATVLFVPGNQIASGFGTYGRGIVGPGETSQLTLTCDQAVSIGTQGGVFINPDETGSVVGNGQQRAATINQVYICGDQVTITFSVAGPGQFNTSLTAG